MLDAHRRRRATRRFKNNYRSLSRPTERTINLDKTSAAELMRHGRKSAAIAESAVKAAAAGLKAAHKGLPLTDERAELSLSEEILRSICNAHRGEISPRDDDRPAADARDWASGQGKHSERPLGFNMEQIYRSRAGGCPQKYVLMSR